MYVKVLSHFFRCIFCCFLLLFFFWLVLQFRIWRMNGFCFLMTQFSFHICLFIYLFFFLAIFSFFAYLFIYLFWCFECVVFFVTHFFITLLLISYAFLSLSSSSFVHTIAKNKIIIFFFKLLLIHFDFSFNFIYCVTLFQIDWHDSIWMYTIW